MNFLLEQAKEKAHQAEIICRMMEMYPNKMDCTEIEAIASLILQVNWRCMRLVHRRTSHKIEVIKKLILTIYFSLIAVESHTLFLGGHYEK
ncbi:hypothetical protein [Enterobacter cloacae complex sp. 279F5]|uniref:hypothetical protein n=1 Tax=Enterobacter cloacae complex sp. 279F5 TaxID=3395874 RepID=UPI003CF2E953